MVLLLLNHVSQIQPKKIAFSFTKSLNLLPRFTREIAHPPPLTTRPYGHTLCPPKLNNLPSPLYNYGENIALWREAPGGTCACTCMSHHSDYSPPDSVKGSYMPHLPAKKEPELNVVVKQNGARDVLHDQIFPWVVFLQLVVLSKIIQKRFLTLKL